MSTYRTPPNVAGRDRPAEAALISSPNAPRELARWSTLRLSFSLGTHFVKKSRA